MENEVAQQLKDASWIVGFASALGSGCVMVLDKVMAFWLSMTKAKNDSAVALADAEKKQELARLADKLSSETADKEKLLAKIEALEKRSEKCEKDHTEALRVAAKLQGQLETLEKFRVRCESDTVALAVQQAQHGEKIAQVEKKLGGT